MKNQILILFAFLILTSCNGRKDDEFQKHCPDPNGPCSLYSEKHSSTPSPISWSTTTNDPAPPGSGSDKPLFGPGSSRDNDDIPEDEGGLGGSSDYKGPGSPDHVPSTGGNVPGGNGGGGPEGPGGGTLSTGGESGTGDCIPGECLDGGGEPKKGGPNEFQKAMDSIGRGFSNLAGEFNGKNHEKRRKAREAKRLLRDAEVTFEHVDTLTNAIADEMAGISRTGNGLGLAGKELESSASDAAFEGIASRYNAKKDSIISQIPTFDEGTDPATANNGKGIYYENQKIATGRKYVDYARERVGTMKGQADFENRSKLVDFADGAITEADAAYKEGKPSEGSFYYELGIAFADAALSMTPIIGTAKDAIELATGRSVLDGRKLTTVELSLAGVGLATLGLAKVGAFGKLAKIGKILSKGSGGADDAARIAKGLERGEEIAAAAARNGLKDEKVIDRIADLVKDGMPCKVAALSPLDRFFALLVPVAYAVDCLPGSVESKIKEILEAPEMLGWQGRVAALEDLGDTANSVSKNGGRLPANYITKEEAEALGWVNKKGNLAEVAPGKSIGGNEFKNQPEVLPKGEYLEADLGYRGGYRGKERMVYTKSGDRIYITNDHYKTFVQVK